MRGEVEEGTGATLAWKHPDFGFFTVCINERPLGAPRDADGADASQWEERVTCVAGTCRPFNDWRAPRNATRLSDDQSDPDAGLVCRRTTALPAWESACVLAVPTGGACDRDVQQCASTGDWCRDGTCVSRSPLGGACSINGGCAERECRRGPAAAGRGRPRRAVRGSAVGVACDAATATWWKRLTCGADGTCGSGVSATTGGALGTTHDGCARSRAAGPPVGGRRSACRVRPSRCKSVVGGGATCVGKWQRRADGCRCDLDCATSDRPCRRWVPVGGVCGGARRVVLGGHPPSRPRGRVRNDGRGGRAVRVDR